MELLIIFLLIALGVSAVNKVSLAAENKLLIAENKSLNALLVSSRNNFNELFKINEDAIRLGNELGAIARSKIDLAEGTKEAIRSVIVEKDKEVAYSTAMMICHVLNDKI